MVDRFDCRNPNPIILLTRNDLLVRTTTPLDWPYIDMLMKHNAWSIGFLQRRAFENYTWGGERNFMCFLAEVNHSPIGYVFITPGHRGQVCRIQQIAVQNDARRFEYGTALVDTVEDYRKAHIRNGIALRCRVDLEANTFWKTLGFQLDSIQMRGTQNHMKFKASNDILHYSRVDIRQQSLFTIAD